MSSPWDAPRTLRRPRTIQPRWLTSGPVDSFRDLHVTSLFREHGGVPLPLKPIDYYLAAEYAIAVWKRPSSRGTVSRAVISFLVALEYAWAGTPFSKCGAPFAGDRLVNNFPRADKVRWKDLYDLHAKHKVYMAANSHALQISQHMAALHEWAKREARKPPLILPSSSSGATFNGTNQPGSVAKPLPTGNITAWGPTNVPIPLPVPNGVPKNAEQQAPTSEPQTVFEYAYGVPEPELVPTHATPEQPPSAVPGVHPAIPMYFSHPFPYMVAPSALPGPALVPPSHVAPVLHFVPGLQTVHVPFIPFDTHSDPRHAPEAHQYQWPPHAIYPHAYHRHESHAAFAPHGPTIPATQPEPDSSRLWGRQADHSGALFVGAGNGSVEHAHGEWRPQ